MKDIILKHFTQYGYADISINLWHEAKLYVNIKGHKPFSYTVEDSFKITSEKLIDATLFGVARKLIPCLQKHKEQLITDMSSGTYFTS